MTSAEEEPTVKSKIGLIFASLLGALLLYVLSVGPVL